MEASAVCAVAIISVRVRKKSGISTTKPSPNPSSGPQCRRVLRRLGRVLGEAQSNTCGVAPRRGLCDSAIRMHKYVLLPVLAGRLILVGCGKKEEATAP